MRDDNVELTGQQEFEDQAEAEMEMDAPAEEQGYLREKPDGEIDPLGEAGWYLEQERLQRGLSLEDVGAETGIHPYHLDAIELGDLTRLPGRDDTLDMVGYYAQYLGFDPEPMMAHFGQFMPAPELVAEPRHPANPAPLSSAKILAFGRMPKIPAFRLNRVPGGAGGLVATLATAALLVAGASYMLMSKGAPVPGEVSQQEQAGAAVPPPPLPDADPMPTSSTGPDTAEISIGEEPMPQDETLAAKAAQSGEDDLVGTGLDGISALIEQNVPSTANDAKALEAMAAAGDVAITKEGREFGSGNGESRLTLKAKAPVWVRIEDSHGNVVMTQMLMKGDTYRVPDRPGLVVIARDGGLLSYMIDGKEKGILGTPGEILVGRSLDLKSFEG
jgi:cytoskeleton protein RodZ